MRTYYKVVQKRKRDYVSAITVKPFALRYVLGERCEQPESSLGIFVFTDLAEARNWSKGWREIAGHPLAVLTGTGKRVRLQSRWISFSPMRPSHLEAFYRDPSFAYKFRRTRYVWELANKDLPVGIGDIGRMIGEAVALEWFLPEEELVP